MGAGNIVLRRGCLALSVLKREQPGGLRHAENTRVRLYLNARPAESRSVPSLCLFGPVHPFFHLKEMMMWDSVRPFPSVHREDY